MLAVLTKSQRRYPVGFTVNDNANKLTRWHMITYYMNDQIKPDESFTMEECLVAAHKQFLANPVKTTTDNA